MLADPPADLSVDVLLTQLAAAMDELGAAEDHLQAMRQEIEDTRVALDRLQRFQGLFEGAPDAYLTTDMAGVVTEVNGMAQKLLGCDAQRLLNAPLALLVESDDRQAFRAMLHRVVRQGGQQVWNMRMAPRPDDVLDVAVSVSVGHHAADATELRWVMRPAEPMRGRDVLARGMRELTRCLAQSADIDELLSILCDRGVAILDASACGVLLADAEGRLRTVAASDEVAEKLQLFELQNTQGPGFDAFNRDDVIVADLIDEHEDRWPGFVARARQQKLRALVAVPMRIRGRVIGSLQFLRARPSRFSDSDVMAALALANFAAFGVTCSRAFEQSHETAQQLQQALESRILIEQAKGMLAERAGVSPAAAFRALRTYARNHQRRLREVCSDLINNELRADDLGVVAE
jgi:PAS domain S-box-containing protein